MSWWNEFKKKCKVQYSLNKTIDAMCHNTQREYSKNYTNCKSAAKTAFNEMNVKTELSNLIKSATTTKYQILN